MKKRMLAACYKYLESLAGAWWLCRKVMAVAQLIAVVVFVASCAASPGVQELASRQEVSGQPTSRQAEQYRLGSGDKIKLNVYNEEDLSGEFDIAGNGILSLPLVGQVQAGGLTVSEFEQRLTKKLKTYVRNPRVSVQVLNYRPFYIRGEVKKGGEYPYSNGLVVADAVAKAGGYSYRAIRNYVYIRHASEIVEKKYSLDTPVRVLPGDNIRVPERYF